MGERRGVAARGSRVGGSRGVAARGSRVAQLRRLTLATQLSFALDLPTVLVVSSDLGSVDRDKNRCCYEYGVRENDSEEQRWGEGVKGCF